MFTEVTDIGYIEKDTEMLTLTLASGVSLTVTENHVHFIAEGGRRIRKQGSELQVGMVLASTRNGANGTIQAISKSVSHGKWSLATKPCTAYANGVLTATSCATIDMSMPVLSGPSSEPRLVHGELADVASGVCDGTACTNSTGNEAFVLSVDGEKKSSELGPEALARALENGLTWHMKAESSLV